MTTKFFLLFQILIHFSSYYLMPSYILRSNSFHSSSLCYQQHLSRISSTSSSSSSSTQLYQSSSTQVVPQKEAVAQLLGKGADTLEDAFLHFKRYFSSYYKDEKYRFRNITHSEENDKRPRVVVVGSGWAAHALLKTIEAEDYHVICVSPRPFFVFTPMLASCTTGTVEYRSILEPIREANPFVDYVEGEIIDIEPNNKLVKVISSLQKRKSFPIIPPGGSSSSTSSSLSSTSSFIQSSNHDNHDKNDKDDNQFIINYDYLVYAAGAIVADFGTPGVKEYCHFIKEIDDVRAIKNKILATFELASLPTTAVDNLQSLLTFVVVGGGPTGVEFAGELCDFIKQDMARLYPRLLKQVKIVLLNAGSSVLNAFDSALQAQALESLRAVGIDILLNTRVTSVTESEVTYKTKASDENVALKFGLCVWAAGTAPRPLTTALAHKLGPAQVQSVLKTGRLQVDAWMRVTGLKNTLASTGATITSGATATTGITTTTGASATTGATATDSVNTHTQRESLKPTPNSMLEGSIFVIGDSSYFNWGYSTTLEHSSTTTANTDSSSSATSSTSNTPTNEEKNVNSHRHTSTSLLLPLIPTSTALPQTAQVAAQQGAYVARLLNRGYDLSEPTPIIQKANLKSDFFKMVFKNKDETDRLTAKPFAFFNLGLLAYIGDSKAVAQMQLGDISSILFASGKEAFFIWRSVYLVKQVSARTRVLVLFDFIKTKVFGRDLTGI